MEYIRKFDNEYDLELFLSDAENNEKVRNYDTKMFYLEEEERMIIGSGRKDIPLDFTKTNAEMQNYDKAHVSSNPNDTVEYNIYYKKLPKGQTNINLASVTGVTGYVVDEQNSKVKMILEDSSLYTTLTRDSDWKYNYADGNVTLLRAIEGDILLDFKGLLYTNLRENSITLYISHNGASRVELYRNGVINDTALNLISGEDYEITADIASGGTLSMAVKSGVSYCDIVGNSLKPKGYKNNGGKIVVTFSSTVHNGYKPISVNIQFDVALEVAKVLNWESIVPSNELTAGNELDLRGLRVSGNCQFFIETTERIQTTDRDRVYKLVGNGSNAIGQRIRINIIGNELYTGAIIDKYVNIRLNVLTMSWDDEVGVIWANESYRQFNNTTKKFVGLENLQAGHPNGLTLSIKTKDISHNLENINIDSVIYSITPSGLGTFIGNIYYPTLPSGEPREVTVKATINARGDYATSQITAKFIIQPVEVVVNEWANGTNEFYPGTAIEDGRGYFNLMYKITTPSTQAIPQYTITVNPKNLFIINDSKLMLGQNLTLQANDTVSTNRQVEVKVTLNPGSNFKKTEVVRTILCKLKPIYFYFIESKVLYHNTSMTFTMSFEDSTLTTNRDIAQEVWNRFKNVSGGGLKNYVDIRYSRSEIDESTMTDEAFSNLIQYNQNWNIDYINNTVANGGGLKLTTKPDLNIYGSSVNSIYLYVKVQIPSFNNYEGFRQIVKFLVTRPQN